MGSKAESLKINKKNDQAIVNGKLIASSKVPDDLMVVGYRMVKGVKVPIYAEIDPEGFYSGRNRKPR